MEKKKVSFFERFSNKVTQASGSSAAFISACALILVWGISGPFFGYSETWQLVINTGTTIITFLMVFVIQKAQNKESKATQLKLDELIASSGASNRLVNIEELDEKDLDRLHDLYKQLTNAISGDELSKAESIETQIRKLRGKTSSDDDKEIERLGLSEEECAKLDLEKQRTYTNKESTDKKAPAK
ncbi:MAG TPA: low affinity iron permease family protein [Saprospiraceae bacterium]|nr:low affinity iron permease family protein [Saprospiraceae bacterium]